MQRILQWGVPALLIIIAIFAAWFFRPWAEYSPSKVISGRNADDRAPYYRSMEEYFPYRTIIGSDSPVTLPRDPKPLDINYVYDGEPRNLEMYGEERGITGLMVVKGGSVVFEEYWRGETAEDLHTSWSVAKSFISTLVGAAVLDGKIESLDDPAEKYAPIYKGTDYGKTSINHLMMMSSGIDFIEDYEVQGSDIRKLFFNTFLLNKDIDKFARQYKRDRAPGGDFHYQSTNSSVLGAVVSGAYGGRSLADIASEKIFKPLGMFESTWLTDRNSETGKELAYCCINMRLEDYAKFGMLYTNDGVVNGTRILPEGWVEFVGTPPKESHEVADGIMGYGQHFWIPLEAEGAIMARGYNGQFIWMDPKNDVVVAMTSADKDFPDHHKEAFPMIRAAAMAGAEVTGIDPHHSHIRLQH